MITMTSGRLCLNYSLLFPILLIRNNKIDQYPSKKYLCRQSDRLRRFVTKTEVWVPTFCPRSLCNLTNFTCLKTILIPYENIFFNLFYLAQIRRNSISNFYFFILLRTLYYNKSCFMKKPVMVDLHNG